MTPFLYALNYRCNCRYFPPPQTLVADGVNLPNHGFGGKNRLSLNGDLAAVGAPGAESAFLYLRSVVEVEGGGGTAGWAWGEEPAVTFTSSDFDYDVVHLRNLVHRQVGGRVASLSIIARKCATKVLPIFLL